MVKFGAFIMTYERETILIDTIDKVLSQTFPPEKILIVDNSATQKTAELMLTLHNPKVVYHKVGYNSGPAGAAAIGLQLLAAEGYDWIYWGDDDDPPIFENTFEILIKTALSDPKCGCVGVVGQFFNKKTGFVKRVPDAMLQSEGTLEVDTIAGGMYKIVNGKMILERNLIPDEQLFFGFEELDFDLQIKKKGYKLLVDKPFYWKHRLHFNRTGLTKKTWHKKSDSALQREYYSTRNILYICFKNTLLSALICILFYSIIKQFLRFKQGFSTGYIGFKITFMAIFHFFIGKMGIRKINI